MKKESFISFKSFAAHWSNLVLIGGVIVVGMNVKPIIRSMLKSIIKEEIQPLIKNDSIQSTSQLRTNLILKDVIQVVVKQIKRSDDYNLSRAKTAEEQIEIYKEQIENYKSMQKLLDQRQEYFYNEHMQSFPEQLYMDTIYQRWPPDTLKKKLNYPTTAQGS